MNKKKIIGLAPMDWITNCAYRIICKELFEKHNTDPSVEFWMWTEFMNVEWFMREPGRLIHHLIHTDYEDKTISQIYWADHHDLVESAKFIDGDMPGFMGIELNIGCPSPKVMSCGWGAGMMKDRPRTIAIIKDIVAATKKPFSIKTRAGLSVEDKIAQKEFILDVAQYCRHIIIHGRTYKQSHTWEVDREYIYDIKRLVGDSCIIIWNGWVNSYEDIHNRMWNLDGIMVWQAAIGWPWIFTGHTPTLQERYDVIVRHAKMMIVLYDYYFSQREQWRALRMPTYQWLNNEIETFEPSKYDHEKTIVEYRKYVFNYISGLPGNRELKVQLASTKDYATIMKYVDTFFDSLQKIQ